MIRVRNPAEESFFNLSESMLFGALAWGRARIAAENGGRVSADRVPIQTALCLSLLRMSEAGRSARASGGE